MRTFFGILPPLLPYSEVPSPVETLPMPERTKLLFSTPKLSDVNVRVGDQVNTGQNMGRAGKGPFVSTTTGQIEEVGVFKGPDGRDYVAVVTRSNQEDSFVHSPKIKLSGSWHKLHSCRISTVDLQTPTPRSP